MFSFHDMREREREREWGGEGGRERERERTFRNITSLIKKKEAIP